MRTHHVIPMVAGALLAVTACTAQPADSGTDKPGPAASSSSPPSTGSPQPSSPSSGGAASSAWTGTHMPKLIGRSLKAAREALPSGTNIEVQDLSSQGRAAADESGWRVCFQSPGASTPLYGSTPVTVKVLKFEENCLQPPS
ncbi:MULTISPECIES: PASTA domain-containing protein [unclassified Streptomyces]|uniref:PASTA domain-containing protein n=1 Tax=unclassified Streptomyces TaxID=2593676 RepID=UPI00225B3AFD|nr:MULTISPECIES: hypothetical protein [unclassified Streptomyces]MCX4632235.1 hypothetical protein [Streptomyces sp. NBC_01443]WSW48044.1 hypothetical protein OG296_35960 [Streptomyces sp. NBC_01001]